jgi:PAS domain S-box-containing protein
LNPSTLLADGSANFQVLLEDGERVFCRIGGHADADGSVLAVLPAAEHPTPATLDRLAHEYGLKEELDCAWAVRPRELIREGGRTTLVLEDPGGEPLERLLGVPFKMDLFLRLAIDISVAVGRLHRRGLLHKDIKPANIMVNCADGQVRLTAFGIASRVPRERQAPEPPETIAGTLAYMAPEQTGRMNRSIDSRSDLYALGVTFYQMLTGSLPFTAADPMEWVHCHIARKPLPPSERSKNIPAPVSEIVMKLLAKTAEERYQTPTGVESDLRYCLAERERKGRIDPFALGEHDAPDRLLLPERLYGRAREVETLLACFDRIVKNGAAELVLVSGYSGVGKSSVVNELHRVLVEPRGLFASGKFDQYKRDIPYSTLAQAFQSLIRSLLGKSDPELAGWREAFREALGPNGRLITDLVPELKLIVGDQLPVPELPPHDAQRRFQLVFRRFLTVFARPEHPLALFLDDLQWLDSATLDLLEDLLTQPDVQHLMLIGAYRDNEVNSAHPLIRKLEAIRKAGAAVHEIILGPLAREDVGRLIADSFHCEPERVTALAELIHEKTAGNPFFANQLISVLVEEDLLTFDYGEGRWSWDLNSIRAKGYTDNVADLMVGKLNRLPVETQQALQLLACMGNGAEFALLEMASQQATEEMHSQLWEAVRAGLIFRSEHSYTFLHDRVQEAAYSLISEEARAKAHLRIGRLLATRIAPEEREEAIFEVVNQLNRGAPLITSQDEREQLAELNLAAGKRAKASSAYASALNYFATGATLLEEGYWERRYELIFALEQHRAQCEFLTGEMPAAEQRLTVLAARAGNTLDRATIASLRVELHLTTGRTSRAVDIGLDYLRGLGIDWSLHPTDEEVRPEYERMWSRLGDRAVEDIIDMPFLSDLTCLVTLEILTRMFSVAARFDANLTALVVCRAVSLSLEFGNCDASCAHYAWLGRVVVRRFGDYQAAYRFGRLACDLVDRRGLTRFQAEVYYVVASNAIPWGQHVRDSRKLMARAFDAASRTGNLIYEGYCLVSLNANMLVAGDPLAETQKAIEASLHQARKMKFRYVTDLVTMQLDYVRTLRGHSRTFASFDDQHPEEDAAERAFTGNPDLAVLETLYWIRVLQARFLAGDHAAANNARSRAERLLWTVSTEVAAAEFHFYGALSLAACCHSAAASETEHLRAHHTRLQAWERNCPANFEHRSALVGAEIARIEGREAEAMRLYEQAIRAADANGFVHHKAIACELAGYFYGARGFEKIATLYLRDARYCYLNWGADAKVRQLEQGYPHLVGEQLAAGPTSTIGVSVEHLDLATVIKVSQAVSGEIVLESLIETLLRTAMAQAGAERALLIMPCGQETRIEAEATASGDRVTVRLIDEAVTEHVLPESVLHYVLRTRETVILDDAAAQSPFGIDSYIRQRQARSILCLPLLNQAKLIRVLYLENNLTPRVFAPARIPVLKLLASQAAIALENAHLYRDVEERERKIRRLVDSNIIGIFIWDFDGRIVEANDEFLRMVHYDREDLVADRIRWAELTPPHWRDRNNARIEQQKSGGRFEPFEKEFTRKDGSRVPILIGGATFEEGGNQGVAFVLDLTERKCAEDALREREAQLAEARRELRLMIDTIPIPVASYSTEARRDFVNAAWKQYTGLSDEAALGTEWSVVAHPDHIATGEKMWRDAFATGEPWHTEERVRRADGQYRWFAIDRVAARDENGKLIKWYGTAYDIEDRKRAEERLRVQHTVAQILAEAATIEEATPRILRAMGECLGWDVGALWRVDREAEALRCVELWHEASIEVPEFERVSREFAFVPGSGLPGRVWSSLEPEYVPDVVPDENFPRGPIAEREGLHAAFGFPILLGGEVLGVIEFFSREIRQPDQELLDMLATIGSQIGQFIERKRAEEAFREAQLELAHANRVVTMGQLTASIAHEVNQPITAAITYALAARRWLSAEPPNFHEVDDALSLIVKEGNRAGDVVGRIRALIKKAPPRRDAVEINNAILEVIALSRTEAANNSVSVRTQLAEGLPCVQGDRVQLQQVLLNLILNAIEAMRDVGEAERELLITTGHEPDGVSVELRDSGPGFAPAALERVFEAFYTTKPDGLGLGLSICRSIIEAHNGRLWASPNVPRGAIFGFIAPAHPAAAS